MDTHSHNRLWTDIRRQLVAVAVLAGVALLVATLAHGGRSVSTSPEAKFTDASARGLAIVPASCPSTPDFVGQCDGTSHPPLYQCSLQISPWVTQPGQSATLSWLGADETQTQYQSGSIDNGIGPVPVSGSALITPQVTTTYTYTGTTLFMGILTLPFSCDATITVGDSSGSCPVGYQQTQGQCVFTGCPSGYTLEGIQCVSSVTTSCPAGYLFQGGHCAPLTCPAGWTLQGNGCIPPPSLQFTAFDATGPSGDFSASGHLQVVPLLVRTGEAVQLYWNVQNASSCSVTGTNGDSWTADSSGASGETSSAITGQTIYTLSCDGLAGAAPPSVSESQTVNVVPVFQER